MCPVSAGFSVRRSDDFDAYAEGRIGVEGIRCLMCEVAPCRCEEDFPFGSAAYVDRVRKLHGGAR